MIIDKSGIFWYVHRKSFNVEKRERISPSGIKQQIEEESMLKGLAHSEFHGWWFL